MHEFGQNSNKTRIWTLREKMRPAGLFLGFTVRKKWLFFSGQIFVIFTKFVTFRWKIEHCVAMNLNNAAFFSQFRVQGDSSKMGQTLRLKPCFNTVPSQLFFKLLWSTVQWFACTTDMYSNLKKKMGRNCVESRF